MLGLIKCFVTPRSWEAPQHNQFTCFWRDCVGMLNDGLMIVGDMNVDDMVLGVGDIVLGVRDMEDSYMEIKTI